MNEIYVVDDSLSVCVAIETTLTDNGYRVVTERSGAAALDYLRDARPRLVICDVILPDADGREICERVRREPRLAATPVIAISGLVDAHVEATVRRAGAVRLLKKPFTPEDLLDAVAEALAGPAPEPPAPAPAEPVPDPLGDALGGRLLEAMSGLPTLRFGLVVSPEGRVVCQSGDHQAADDEVARPLVEIVRRSAVVAEWLGQTDPHQLIFQADDGVVIAQRYGDHLAVAALADATVLGKARFILARLRRQLGAPSRLEPSTRS